MKINKLSDKELEVVTEHKQFYFKNILEMDRETKLQEIAAIDQLLEHFD